MDVVNIGILGAGLMAERMAATIIRMDGVNLYAVAARDAERAKQFAAKFGAEKHFGSYAGMVDDPRLHLVHIATPNSFHYEHMMLCLRHGKHVLCEKPFTIEPKHAAEVFATAKAAGLLATEALWTRYMPFPAELKRMLDDGLVGERLFLSANIGNDITAMRRLRDPGLGGGALLDLGVYALNFADMFMDERPAGVESSSVPFPTGVDAQNAILLSYPSGQMASLFTSMVVATDRRGIIYGKKGYLVVENINNPVSAQLFTPDRKPGRAYHRPDQISGLEYEVAAAALAIRQGATECAEMPHAVTQFIVEQMDCIKKKWRAG